MIDRFAKSGKAAEDFSYCKKQQLGASEPLNPIQRV